jgi:hypothetical protein
MTKDELYNKLREARFRHMNKNTTDSSYVDCVIRYVQKYLEEKNKKEMNNNGK